MLARVLIAAVLAVLSVQASAQDRWTTYRNDRFGTAIEYPSRFRPGRPPDNNDGQSFTSPDGAALSVWASFNALEHELAGHEQFIRDAADAKDHITYRASGSNWFVLSGTRDDRIFYQRYLFSHRSEVINAFEISYPAALAASYGPVVTRMSKSLRPGRGYQTKGSP